MSLTLLVAAPALLLLGVALGAGARRAVRAHRPLAIGLLGLGGALCLALALLAGTLLLGLRGYRELTYEELAATVQTQPVARQHFRVIITLPDRRLAMYDLSGDAFYVDAHILKWHPLASALGLHTAYTLDRVAGRYNDVLEERARPHTVYALARTGPWTCSSSRAAGCSGRWWTRSTARRRSSPPACLRPTSCGSRPRGCSCAGPPRSGGTQPISAGRHRRPVLAPPGPLRPTGDLMPSDPTDLIQRAQRGDQVAFEAPCGE